MSVEPQGESILTKEGPPVKKQCQRLRYSCVSCSYRTDRRDHLTTHARTHTGEKPFKCTDCGKRFSDQSAQRRHTRAHSGEKPFQCTTCHKGFALVQHLNQHVRTHTGEKPFKCKFCDRCFSQEVNLHTHLRTHNEEKPHECTACGKQFSFAHHLEAHVRTHTGEKPFVCSVCDRRFAVATNLARHLLIHTAAKPYECSDCGATFTTSSNLRRHERSHEQASNWTHVCNLASFATRRYAPGQGLLACATRCPDQRRLLDHVQRCHTPGGIAARFRSEERLAEFLRDKRWEFDRDRTNFVSFKSCQQLGFEGLGARPDFHLTGFQALPAGRACVVILCCDEFAHRYYACDVVRMYKINAALRENPALAGCKLVWIRFNPHYFLVDGIVHDPPLQARFKRLHELLSDLRSGRLGWAQPTSILHLYYDRSTKKKEPVWEAVARKLYRADESHPNYHAIQQLRQCVVPVW